MDIWMIGCLFLPLLGTVLGAGTVFFIKGGEMPQHFYGFTAGMMLAAVGILLGPAIEKGVLPVAIGLILGSGSLYLTDHMTPQKSGTGKRNLLILAITLHNFPEGMAVGIAMAGAAEGNAALSISEAVTMALAVAVQNFPDGVVAAVPLRRNGYCKARAFFWGACSGMVEPVTAMLSAFLTHLVGTLLPYVLAYAAGAMLYVVSEELIPQSQRGSNIHGSAMSLVAGFIVMLVLETR